MPSRTSSIATHAATKEPAAALPPSTAPQSPIRSRRTRQLTVKRCYPLARAFGDYNLDGHLDLYVAPMALTRRVPIINPLVCALMSTARPPLTAAAAVHCVVCACYRYVANFDAYNTLYKNNGDGTFTQVMGGRDATGAARMGCYTMPSATGGYYGGTSSGWGYASSSTSYLEGITCHTRSVAFGDYNADGYLDLLEGGQGMLTTIRRNDCGSMSASECAAGPFTELASLPWTKTGFEVSSQVAWGDFGAQ